MHYLPLNEYAITISFCETPNERSRKAISRLDRALQAHPFPGFLEAVPAYVSLTVFYDVKVIQRQQVIRYLEDLQQWEEQHKGGGEASVVDIPVCYGGVFGPDLPFVAAHTGLTETAVIDIHRSAIYQVHMIGFMPGFAYLGGMSDRIASPRLATPRPHVPPGSVGIAGTQTGVYPLVSPGGWQLIGRTPLRLFDANRPSPSLLAAGQQVRFYPIDADMFENLTNDTPDAD